MNKYPPLHKCHEKRPRAGGLRGSGETVRIEIAVVLFPHPCLFVGKMLFAGGPLAKTVHLGGAACATACQDCVKDGNFSAGRFCVSGRGAGTPQSADTMHSIPCFSSIRFQDFRKITTKQTQRRDWKMPPASGIVVSARASGGLPRSRGKLPEAPVRRGDGTLPR
jgi:hypothetical protein